MPNKEQTGEKELNLFKHIGALFELGSEKSIYESIAAPLSRFLDGSVVVVNSYDGMSNTLRVRAVAGIEAHIDKVVSTLGNHPVKISVPMNREAKEDVSTGVLQRVAGGIHELATYSIPKAICARIEDILGISRTYAIGITWRDEIIGSIAILTRSDIIDPVCTETFVKYAAIAVQRRLDGR